MLDMHIRPSELMDISDAYTAFCFDEACAYIISEMRDGKEPIMNNNGKEKECRKPSDLYGKYNK